VRKGRKAPELAALQKRRPISEPEGGGRWREKVRGAPCGRRKKKSVHVIMGDPVGGQKTRAKGFVDATERGPIFKKRDWRKRLLGGKVTVEM